MTSKCKIVQDHYGARMCGTCDDTNTCSDKSLSTALCRIPNAANAKMAMIAPRFSPLQIFDGDVDAKVRALTVKNLKTAITNLHDDLTGAYPDAEPGAVDITWADIAQCKKLGSGTKKYGRDGALELGMDPKYPIGGKFAINTLWTPDNNPIPIAVDYIMNPDLFTIIVLMFIVIIFGVVVLGPHRRPSQPHTYTYK